MISAIDIDGSIFIPIIFFISGISFISTIAPRSENKFECLGICVCVCECICVCVLLFICVCVLGKAFTGEKIEQNESDYMCGGCGRHFVFGLI